MGRESKQTFFQRCHTDCQQTHEKMLNIINHQSNANQNKMWYHLTPDRMVMKRTKYNKCWWGCGLKGNLMHCWWEGKLVQPLWKTVWRFSPKLKIELLHDPAIPLLGIDSKKTKTLIWKDIWTPMFTAALFRIAKIWKQPKYSLMDK